jgi:hypothetical protein
MYDRSRSAVPIYGEDHPTVARVRNNLARVLHGLGEPALVADEFWFRCRKL